jgi:hypothetical protein
MSTTRTSRPGFVIHGSRLNPDDPHDLAYLSAAGKISDPDAAARLEMIIRRARSRSRLRRALQRLFQGAM